MKYSFKDLVDIPRLQELTDELYVAASIPSAIITMEGEILTGSGWQKICTDFHRRHPQIEKECIQSDTAIRTKIDEGEPFVIYRCPRGLVDASSPILIAGEHMASVFSGQVFLEPPDRIVERFFREQARRFGFDETAYMQAFKQIPVFTEKQFRAGVAFLAKLAHLVADMGLTRLKELEAMSLLRESESRYRHLFDMESDAIFLIDKETGGILEANRAATSIYGYSRDELLRLKNTDISAEPDKTRSATRNELMVIPVRYHRKKDGTVFPVEITASHIEWQGRGVHIAAIRDITFRIEAEQARLELDRRLQQAQKMESIGNLAGGIAHDFNNILSPIIGMAELLQDDLPPGSMERENSQAILQAGLRGRDLVKQILAFSRQTEPKKVPVRFQQVLREAINLSRSTIPSNIVINQDIQNDCGLIMADPTQLHRIAINLITNAYHAVDLSGGSINIRLREVVSEKSRTGRGNTRSGRYAELSVSDTGSGMEPQVMEQIFEPYFTTKGSGKGTGLGLAVVYGIVKDHDGDISVQSEIGRGTSFNVCLPLMEKSAGSPDDENLEPQHIGHEHILVVDDEDAIVRLERQMLERLGYRVTARTSSIEALEAFKANPATFDLVLTDMAMPNMTGDRLARELLALRPDLPVVICTGFSERLNPEKAAAMGVKGFLLKPVVKSDLARIMRSVLDGTFQEEQQT